MVQIGIFDRVEDQASLDEVIGKIAVATWGRRHWAADGDEREKPKHPLAYGEGGVMQLHGTVTLYTTPGFDLKCIDAGVYEIHAEKDAVLKMVAIQDDIRFPVVLPYSTLQHLRSPASRGGE